MLLNKKNMKKIVLVGLLLFSLISCSEDKETSDEIAIQETSMNINLNSPKTNISGKDVKRGTLPVVINAAVIIVQPWTLAGGIDPSRVESVFNFDIVSDNKAGAADGFEIKNFSTGTSRIFVRAHSSVPGKGYEWVYGIWTGESSTASVNDLFIKWEAKPVAINYFIPAKIMDLIAGVNNPVSFTLEAMNGRMISVFQLSNELKSWNYSATVETTMGSGSSAGLMTVDKTRNAVSYLDGYYTTEGKPIKHIINIFDDKGEKVAQYAVPADVKNGESTNTIFTILSDKIPAANKLQTTILVPDFKSPLPSVKDI